MDTVAKVAALEAHREEHEKRHDREDDVLVKNFDRIDKRLDDGEKRFDNVDHNVGELKTLIINYCKNTNGRHPLASEPDSEPPTKRSPKEIVIRIGIPFASGGGVAWLIYYLVDHFARTGKLPLP